MRPLLVGMNNPLSVLPEHALWPDPPGCTGHRIWQMLSEVTGCEKRQYLRAFERTNLVEGQPWSAAAGRAGAEAVQTRMGGRRTVLLGAAVPPCLGLPRVPWGSWQVAWRLPLGEGVHTNASEWCMIPHPSGLNRWYNDPDNRRSVAELLAELYRSSREEMAA